MVGGMKDVIWAMREWDAAGVDCAEAILVGTQHSSPRPTGARLVVNAKGEVAGAVSMGCVESDLREHLLALMRGEGVPRLVHYGSAFAAAMEVGLTCGGEIDVWIRRHEPGAAAWKGVLELAPDSRAILLTRLDEASGQALLHAGDAPPAAEMAEALEGVWRRGGARRIAAHEAVYFAELLAPEPRLLIVGASPIASALCDLAVRVGFRAWIVDPRRDFARAEMFPGAEGVLHRWPEEGLAEAGLDEHAYVAVLAHDSKLDVPALGAALRAGARYVGLLGSKGTQADRRAKLAAEGHSPEELARIRGPIGLKSIGALEPSEIAVSILAELVMARRGTL